MKTAIEMLIEELQNGFLEDRFNNSSDILLLCVKYQSEEKQQIIDAFDAYTSKRRENITEGIYYYTSTFETNK